MRSFLASLYTMPSGSTSLIFCIFEGVLHPWSLLYLEAMNTIKLIIISDTHRASENIERAISLQPRADAVIFLGDGLSDAALSAELHPEFTWYAVRGNCDFQDTLSERPVPKCAMTVLGGKKIVYTHGDLFGVKGGIGGLISLAKETGADVVLYGHTHEKRVDYIDGVYYANPGSAGGYRPTAMLLTISGDSLLFSEMEL